MIVRDIYEDARSVLNYGDQDLIFDRVTDAVETLANKGNFDILLGYLNISTDEPTGTLVTLPLDVETPLRVNIDHNPTFTRGRVYEFSLNGPGEETERTDWAWEDKGTVPVMEQPLTPEPLVTVSNTADNGKNFTVYYRNEANEAKTFTLVLSPTPIIPENVVKVERIIKDPTQFSVQLQTQSGQVLGTYGPAITEPQLRQIRLSKAGSTAYIMFRRNRYKVVSLDDFIPIRSKMGLMYMLKAHQAYREDRFQDGQGFEQQAVTLAKEEQEQRHSYGAGQAGESATIRNLNIANRDSVIVADIFDEASQIVGPIGDRKVFDRITEAIELLDGKANWDGKIGYVDITTDTTRGYITLPRYVDNILKLNISGQPSSMKSKWYEFHLNGPGENWTSCSSWKDEGEVVTLQHVTYPQKFVAIPDLAVDEGTAIRGFGLFDGKKIFTLDGPSGAPQEGFPITCTLSGTVTSTQLVDDLQRIDKGESRGFIQLVGVDNLGANLLVQGYWQPDETSPHYRRIKLPTFGEVVRAMYRKNTLRITSLTDQLHLKSKTAILCALRALEMLRQNQYDQSTAMEATAVRLLSERNQIDNQNENREVEFIDNHESAGYLDF